VTTQNSELENLIKVGLLNPDRSAVSIQRDKHMSFAICFLLTLDKAQEEYLLLDNEGTTPNAPLFFRQQFVSYLSPLQRQLF
jgi:hypothetical protein